MTGLAVVMSNGICRTIRPLRCPVQRKHSMHTHIGCACQSTHLLPMPSLFRCSRHHFNSLDNDSDNQHSIESPPVPVATYQQSPMQPTAKHPMSIDATTQAQLGQADVSGTVRSYQSYSAIIIHVSICTSMYICLLICTYAR